MIPQPYRGGLHWPITQTRNRTSGGTYQLGGSNASGTVNNARSRLQEHYNLEAQVAAEKRKEKERKKKMEWLERQEKLVKPGYTLGTSHESSPAAKLQYGPQNYEEEEIAAGGQFSSGSNASGTVNNARSRLQEHYNLEAQVAAEKRKEKERKKKMEWLERQEKLVKPGYTLGTSHEYSPDAKLQCDPQNYEEEEIAAGGQFSSDEDSETQRDYRSEMAAARARFQERYNAALQQTTSQLQKASIAGEK